MYYHLLYIYIIYLCLLPVIQLYISSIYCRSTIYTYLYYIFTRYYLLISLLSITTTEVQIIKEGMLHIKYIGLNKWFNEWMNEWKLETTLCDRSFYGFVCGVKKLKAQNVTEFLGFTNVVIQIHLCLTSGSQFWSSQCAFCGAFPVPVGKDRRWIFQKPLTWL